MCKTIRSTADIFMIYSYFTADNLSKTAISTADNSSNFPYDNCGDESMAMAINQAKAENPAASTP